MPQPVIGNGPLVIAPHPEAAETARAVLEDGGSVVDAAIAAELVLGVVAPHSSGLGGGGFLLTREGKTGALEVYDGQVFAPATAGPAMFLLPDGEPRSRHDAGIGGLGVGVPGMVALFARAHRDHGVVAWGSLFDSAIARAEGGFTVSADLAEAVAARPALARFPGLAEGLFGADGTPLPAGASLTNPRLAETLEAIAIEGGDVFYLGDIGTAVGEAVRRAPRYPATWEPADLRDYQSVKRRPLCVPYRGYRLCGLPAPANGSAQVMATLGILDRLPAAAEGGIDEEVAAHRLIEARRLAASQVGRAIGDPDFADVNAATALGSARLAALTTRIDDSRRAADAADPDAPTAAPTMTQITVADAQGNVAILVASLGDPFGSLVAAEGFFLNSQLTGFDFIPDRDGEPTVNRAEALKRPRAAFPPVMLFAADGKPVAVVGASGGTDPIGDVVRTLSGIVTGDAPGAAIARPAVSLVGDSVELEAGTPVAWLDRALRRRGHETRIVAHAGGVQAVRWGPRGLEAATESRHHQVVLAGIGMSDAEAPAEAAPPQLELLFGDAHEEDHGGDATVD